MENRRVQKLRECRRRRKIRKIKRIAAVTLSLIALIAVFTVAVKNVEGTKDKLPPDATTAATAENVPETEVQYTQQDIYGCELIGTYDYPFNMISQDWSGEEVEGFYYHEISADAAAAGGQMPVIMQVYTYIVCQNYGVDYEMVFALIERESWCKWEAVGDDGDSIGYMQIQERWHKERMERLGVSDLTNPFGNVRVGVDYLAELHEKTGNWMDTLAAYNHGLAGAQKHLWSKGIHEYAYNTGIMERAQQLKDETAAARAKLKEGE